MELICFQGVSIQDLLPVTDLLLKNRCVVDAVEDLQEILVKQSDTDVKIDILIQTTQTQLLKC